MGISTANYGLRTNRVEKFITRMIALLATATDNRRVQKLTKCGIPRVTAMIRWNVRLVSTLMIVLGLLVGSAHAWHGPHGWHHGIHHGYSRGLSYHNYGFGFNHHSFYRPNYSSFFGSFSSVGYWPSTYYYSSYRSYTPYYGLRFSYQPTYYYPTYYAPTYYVPTYYLPTYSAPIYFHSCLSTNVAPVTYSTVSSSAPNYPASPDGLSFSATASDSYLMRKPATPWLPQYQETSGSPFNGKKSTAGYFVSTGVTKTESNAVPSDILAAADAILAAGGYRQAAQAYAQLALSYGDSSDLYVRRFVAQLADGNYEQAAVIINLVDVSGIKLDRSNLPQGELKAALGLVEKNSDFIANRVEGLAANALQQADDPIPLLTLAKWLALSGDDQRAELFSRRADQLRTSN
jgi:hypothetical protein